LFLKALIGGEEDNVEELDKEKIIIILLHYNTVRTLNPEKKYN